MTPKIEIGEQAEDTITGFRGIVTARTDYLGGSGTLLLQPRVDLHGKHVDPVWFEAGRVRRVEHPAQPAGDLTEVF